MSRLGPEVWARLLAERPDGENLWARRASPGISERLVAALDREGRRHLLVLLRDDEGDIQDERSRGVGVTTLELVVPGHEPGRYLDVSCNDALGHETFDLIGGELADRLSTGRETAPEVISRVLAKWRRFWGQPAKQMLSREEQLGLFGELWFLSVWLMPRVGPVEAVVRWRGPKGARHDFEWLGESVEVKSTLSTRGRIHRIHGLEQLAPPTNGRLLFFSLRLREEGGASNTLPALVASCRVGLQGDANALAAFEDLLGRAGYSSLYENEYADFRLRIVDEGLFRVEGAFPRLTPLSFPSDLPGGIEHVDYEINLAAVGDLLVAVSAEAFVPL